MTRTNRNRVIEYGEVFTSEMLVNKMLDMVSQETKRIDSLFLEPACGTGNFLVEVLRRKVEFSKSNFGTNQLEFELRTLQAVGSIYGVDVLKDNVEKCKNRLFETVIDNYKNLFEDTVNKKFLDVTRFILGRNILWGNFLTQKVPDSEAPIVLSKWNFIEGNNIIRLDYPLKALLDYQPMEEGTLFSDDHKHALNPKPLKEFQPVNFLELNDAEHPES